MKRAFAIVIATLMIASMVAMPLGGAVATVSAQQSGPSGMVALGPEQVSEDLPSGTTVPLRASDLEGSVYAGSNADTLEIIVTTPDRAGQYMSSNANVIADDDVALVLRDQTMHDGRDVAVDIDVLEAAIGYVPPVAYGTHSSGEEWQSAITREGTVASWHIPKFSANTVTFTGGIELTGDAAGDGTRYQYELGTLDGVADYGINVTGVETTLSNSFSTTAQDGDTIGYSVGGNAAPRDATVTLTGKGESVARGPVTITDSGSATVDPQGTRVEDATVTFTGQKETESISASKSGIVGSGSLSTDVYGSETVDLQLSLTGSKRTIDETSVNLPTLRAEVPWPDGNSPLKKTKTDTIYTANRDGNYKMTVALDGTANHEINQVLNFYYEVYDSSSGSWGGRNTIGGKGFSGPKTFDITLDDGDKIRVTRNVESWAPGYYSEIPSGTYSIDRVATQETVTGSLDGTSFSETVSDGATTTTTISVSPGGTKTLNVDATNGLEIAAELSGTEVTLAQNPSLTVDGETVSHTGTLADGETVTKTLTGLTPGSYTADVSVSGPIFTSVEWTDVTETTDPSVSIGSSTVSHTGVLEPGETVTQSVDLSTGDDTASVSGSGPVDVAASWTEVTQTTNPTVRVNGYETDHSGTLADGETVSLATNEAWLQEGTNNVTILTDSPERGPESLVGLTYRHDAAGTTRSIDVDATSWTETFNISHTYPAETLDASATLTFVDDVAEIHTVKYRVNGGAWQEPPHYQLNGTDLKVGFGDVSADTDIDVRATGYKIRAYDGDVTVTKPTVEGDELATEVTITDLNPDGQFGLDLTGTPLGDRLHYAAEESWSGEAAYTSHTADGIQILHADDANVGSTLTVKTMPLAVTPETGAIEAEVEDTETPTVSLRKGGTVGASRVNVKYFDTIPGDRYVLWSETKDVEIDADRAQSPVSFITDGTAETYSIIQRDENAGATGAGAGGPIQTQETLPLILVFAGVGAVLVGTTFVSRRFGIGGWLLPATATSLTLIAVHVLAPVSPLTRVAELAYQSNVVTIAAVGALLIGMWQLDERTSGSVPWYVRGIIGLLSVIWALETLSPGVILGGLRAGIESMGPLIVIVIVGGGAYLIREWIQARRAPDTVVRFSAGSEEN